MLQGAAVMFSRRMRRSVKRHPTTRPLWWWNGNSQLSGTMMIQYQQPPGSPFWCIDSDTSRHCATWHAKQAYIGRCVGPVGVLRVSTLPKGGVHGIWCFELVLFAHLWSFRQQLEYGIFVDREVFVWNFWYEIGAGLLWEVLFLQGFQYEVILHSFRFLLQVVF